MIGFASLPMTPAPQVGEVLSSWLARVGARYDLRADELLTRIGIDRHPARELDWQPSREIDRALSVLTGEKNGRIARMRCGRPHGRLWGRDSPAWCRTCVREDLMSQGETWERRGWRYGVTVVCARHCRLLENICPCCGRSNAGCVFVGKDGRIRAFCAIRNMRINLWHDSSGGELPWHMKLDRQIVTLLVALESDVRRVLCGSPPRARWRDMSATRNLADLLAEFVTLVLFRIGRMPALAPPFYWMIERPDWRSQFRHTPAVLPIDLATGILILAAVLLPARDTSRAKEPVFWAPSGQEADLQTLNTASFTIWLDQRAPGWGRALLS